MILIITAMNTNLKKGLAKTDQVHQKIHLL